MNLWCNILTVPFFFFFFPSCSAVPPVNPVSGDTAVFLSFTDVLSAVTHLTIAHLCVYPQGGAITVILETVYIYS